MPPTSKRRRARNTTVPLRESKTAKRVRAQAVLEKLIEVFPDAQTALDYRNPFELLVATLLSAQCTDKRVNKETPALFAAMPNAQTMAKASVDDIRVFVKSINFFNNKAKNLHKTANILVDKHGGEVPDTMEDLVELAGVARKTANCVLGQGFGKPLGVVVDTHVGRIARRLNFTVEADPVKVERDLMALFPQVRWVYISHAWIDLGRPICTARKAKCDECPLAVLCPQVID
ncbi:MAG: endonuclease III [Planctomycetes bacterium]|jgi:endonuclease III|nr:endonuclease III [Planctomycetota bacterium]MBT4029584.1 endonuclease III [Planctomycetota bacterium]MBT4560546.1 endonuclease III [Planctomycetota bacterium]MBT5101577.1 endonuclease III [Planctomycetota bacterium]MBT5119380.1 endonuclease III [Planctomycetota bacterium]